jgi:hypothetical protein
MMAAGVGFCRFRTGIGCDLQRIGSGEKPGFFVGNCWDLAVCGVETGLLSRRSHSINREPQQHRIAA